MQYHLQKKILFTFSLFLCGIFWAFSVHAATSISLLGNQAKNVFLWVIGIAALLAGVSFAIGAVQYLFSLEKPENKKDAANRMWNSLLGLLVCLGSILILNTINPQLSNLQIGQPIGEQLSGVYNSNGNPDQDLGASFQVNDSSALMGAGYKDIKYVCKGVDGKLVNNNVPILIWYYPKINFQDSDASFKNTTVTELPCNQSSSISGSSFKISYKQPGVYFFLTADCSGFRSEAQIATLSPIDDPFKGKMKSMQIINGTPLGGTAGTFTTFYGIILHDTSSTSQLGTCSEPFYAFDSYNGTSGNNCYQVKNINPVSADIFNINIFVSSSGVRLPVGIQNTGATLYSKPWGWQKNSYAGESNQFITQAESDNKKWLKSITPSRANFTYGPCAPTANSCETANYKKICPNFAQCPGSIQLSGSYLMVLSTGSQYGNTISIPSASYNTSTCQIYRSSINSVKEQEFTGTSNTIGSITLIPIK